MTDHAGFTLIGDNNLYQVDETSYCMTMVASGLISSLATATQTEAGTQFEDDVYLCKGTYTGESPVFGLYVVSTNLLTQAAGYLRIWLDSGVWHFIIAIYAQGGGVDLTGAKYFIYDRPKPSVPGYGLEVYDASSNLVFSTMYPVLPIAGKQDVQLDSSKRYAALGPFFKYYGFIDTVTYTDNTTANFFDRTYTGFSCQDGCVYEFPLNVRTPQSGGSGWDANFGVSQTVWALDVTLYT